MSLSNLQNCGLVYIIRYKQHPALVETENNFYKIGFTSKSTIEGRLRDLQTSTPFEIEVVYVIRAINPQIIEKFLHERLQKYHHRGEWYKLTPAIVKQIKAKFPPDIVFEWA